MIKFNFFEENRRTKENCRKEAERLYEKYYLDNTVDNMIIRLHMEDILKEKYSAKEAELISKMLWDMLIKQNENDKKRFMSTLDLSAF